MADIVPPTFAVGPAQKYMGQKIWMAFSIEASWYLTLHNGMAEGDGTTETASWPEGDAAAQPVPFATIIAACASDRFTPIAEVVARNAHKRAQKAAVAER